MEQELGLESGTGWVRGHPGRTLVAVLLVLGLGLGLGWYWVVRDSPEPVVPIVSSTYRPVPVDHEVVYLLESDPPNARLSADITYTTSSGDEQQSGVSVPLTLKSGSRGLHFTMALGRFFYFSAQNTSGYGDLTCRVLVDGVEVSHATARGGYTIATCKGTVG